MILIKIIYSLIINIRNFLYDKKILISYKSSIPVVSVGNITVGGTGKTPFVVYLANYFKGLGRKPLIITRGYKRESVGQILVTKEHQYSADYIGDEPFLIASLCDNVDVIINKNRVNAIKWAEEKKEKYDLIILDDGFQHRSVHRDFNILLINSSQKMKAYPPSGELREPIKNINRADCVIFTKKNPGNKIKKIIDSYKIPTFEADISFNISDESIKRGISFCGIADPAFFLKTLNYLSIQTNQHINFRDHQKYDSYSIKKIENILQAHNEKTFYTTYKDWVKLPKKLIEQYNGIYIDLNMSIKKDQFLNFKNLLYKKTNL